MKQGGKPTHCDQRKATALNAIRQANRAPPGSKNGACIQRDNPGTWERLLFPCRKSEDGVLTLNKSPGAVVGKLQPTQRAEKTGHERKRRMQGIGGRATSEGPREGRWAVVAEHSTDDVCTYDVRVGKVGN